MKKNILLLSALLAIVAVFLFYPTVEYNRIVVPESVYAGKDCGCECVSESRPWYSTFNYWFWLFIVAIPLIIFSLKPTAPKSQRAVRTFIAIIVGYGVSIFAVLLMQDIHNGPFMVWSDYPYQKSFDEPGAKCVGLGQGNIGIFFIGWIYSLLYTGLWEIIWAKYHQKYTNLLGADFQPDLLSKAAAKISSYSIKLLICALIALPFAGAIYYGLEHFNLLR